MKWAVFDLDGTLAKSDWRLNYLPDWDAFHRASVDDIPYQTMIDFVNKCSRDYKVSILTGRSEAHRGITMTWLVKHGFMYHELLMKPNDDYRHAPMFKTDVLKSLNREIEFIVDDDDRCVDAFIEMGLKAYLVHEGKVFL
jgi:hypothetical protein